MKPLLEPFDQVEPLGQSGVWLARGTHPSIWVAANIKKGNWYTLHYSSDVTSPLGRVECIFDTTMQSHLPVCLLPAPILGRQVGFFQAPEDCLGFILRMTSSVERFYFHVNALRNISSLLLFSRALSRDRHNLSLSVGARLIKAEEEFAQAFRFGCSGLEVEKVREWHDACSLEPVAPSTDISLHKNVPIYQKNKNTLPIVHGISFKLIDFLENPGSAFLIHNEKILTSVSYASRLLFNLIERQPELEMIVPDETIRHYGDGTIKADRLPITFSQFNYKNFPEYFNSCIITPRGVERLIAEYSADMILSYGAIRDYIDQTLSDRRQVIASVKTPLLIHNRLSEEHGGSQEKEKRSSKGECSSTSQRRAHDALSFSVIIPTRNNFKLLKNCIETIRQWEGEGHQIIVVDNGSDRKTKRQYAAFDQYRVWLSIIERPGPFNFSELCNQGAAVARGDVLIFLNDDTEIREPHSLARLSAWLSDPTIGVVGPCLLFPNGKIQHIGIVIGMGGIADHVCHGLLPSDRNYKAAFSRPREVSAVTGACLAMRRETFFALAGFDELNLPVECNDVDLCLRVGEHGLKVIIDPTIQMMHQQSASRGFAFRPFRRYARERRYFQERWRDLILNDPFFHPAYSLFSTTPRLDD